MLRTFIFGLFGVPPARQQNFVKVRDPKHPNDVEKAYQWELKHYKCINEYQDIKEGVEIHTVVLEKEIPIEFLVMQKKPTSTQSTTFGGNNNEVISTTTTSKVHVLASKKTPCFLSFAVGKGLYRGISGMKYEIKLYRVNDKGLLIKSGANSMPFQITISKLASSIDSSKMHYVYEQGKNDTSHLTLYPKAVGDYSISIKIDNQHIFDFKKDSSYQILLCLLDTLKSTTDMSIKTLVVKSLSNFCTKELITPNDPSYYFGSEMPMYYQWEYNIQALFPPDQAVEYACSHENMFKDDSEHMFFLSLTIANMLNASESLNIHEKFSHGNGLNLLKLFVLSHNCSTRSESFRSFQYISSINDACKKNLIQNGTITFLMSSLFDCTSVEVPFIINCIANLAEYDPGCVDVIGMDGIDKLVAVIQQSNARSVTIILAHILTHNEKYKQRIVTGAGKPFLANVLELVRANKLSVLRHIAPSDVVLGEEIASGVSGIVRRGEWEGHPVAIKSYDVENMGLEDAAKEFYRETTFMSLVRHENIVYCIGGSIAADNIFFVSDYFARGSLQHVIRATDLPLSNYKIVHIALQTARGMAHLHQLGIIHRDLKSGNLLIDESWNVRICDFGVSRVVDIRMSKAVGTFCYMAPEVLCGGVEYTQAADIYSYGMVLWECLARVEPYADMDRIDWTNKVLNSTYRPEIPATCMPELAAIIRSCWVANPTERPPFTAIIEALTVLKVGMENNGIFEVLTPPRQSFCNNENMVTIDLSSHPTEELKNLVIDDDKPATLADYGITSMSTSLSSNSSHGSPANQSPISPSPASHSSNSSLDSSPASPSPLSHSATSPILWRNPNQRWESAAPEPAGNKKRLSAFRSTTPTQSTTTAPQVVTPKPSVRISNETLETTTPIPIPSGRTSPGDSKPIINNNSSDTTDTFSSFSTLTCDSTGMTPTHSFSSEAQSFPDSSVSTSHGFIKMARKPAAMGNSRSNSTNSTISSSPSSTPISPSFSESDLLLDKRPDLLNQQPQQPSNEKTPSSSSSTPSSASPQTSPRPASVVVFSAAKLKPAAKPTSTPTPPPTAPVAADPNPNKMCPKPSLTPSSPAKFAPVIQPNILRKQQDLIGRK
eukprot:gene20364-24433_t